MPTRLQDFIGAVTTQTPASVPGPKIEDAVVGLLLSSVTAPVDQIFTSAEAGDGIGVVASSGSAAHTGASMAGMARFTPLSFAITAPISYFNMANAEYNRHQIEMRNLQQFIDSNHQAIQTFINQIPALDSSHHLSNPHLDEFAHLRYALLHGGQTYTYMRQLPTTGEGGWPPVYEETGNRAEDLRNSVAEYLMKNPDVLALAEAESVQRPPATTYVHAPPRYTSPSQTPPR